MKYKQFGVLTASKLLRITNSLHFGQNFAKKEQPKEFAFQANLSNGYFLVTAFS